MYKQMILSQFVQRTVCLAVSMLFLLLLNGCVSNSHKPCCQFDWMPQLSEANPKYTERLAHGGERDKVLNLMNIGGNIFSEGHYSLSQKLFMEASFEIEVLYGMSAEARKLRQDFFAAAEDASSPYYREQVKFFRGEPYERMMVYYYLGISYLLKGDYENAHAAFINGQLQDAIAEEEQHQSDFPPLEGLLYFTARKISSSVQAQHQKRLQEMQQSALKTDHLKAPVIVIVESGQSATKIQQGEHKEILSFRCNADEVNEVNVTLEKQTLLLIKSGDLCWQATTRGGREIDGILAQKALWKKTWTQREKSSRQHRDQIGDKQASSEKKIKEADVYTNSNNNSRLKASNMSQSGGMMSTTQVVISRVLKKSIHPEADIRAWTALPAHIWLGTIDQGSGDYVTIQYNKGNRNISRKVNIYTTQNNTGVVWLKIK
ncbi:MAG: hypothetical protein DRR19_11710 [Candidatus Parabeggiatoa sp. nov. 1]|nr:MAG: hypothetical protein DRR19_11710 [Gammaproteobacteria bacterium]